MSDQLFTQADVDRLLGEGLARAEGRLKKAYEADLAALRQQNEALRAQTESRGAAQTDELQQARAVAAEAQAEAEVVRQEVARLRRAYLVERCAREIDPTVPPEFLTPIETDPAVAQAEDEPEAVRQAVQAAAERWRERAERLFGAGAAAARSDIGSPTNPPGQRPAGAPDLSNPPDPVTHPKEYRAWRQRVGLSSQ